MKNYILAISALTFSAIAIHSDGSRPQITLNHEANELQAVISDAAFPLDERIAECRTRLSTLAHGNGTVLQTFDTFVAELNQIAGSLTASDLEKILAGVEFAADKHQSQVRKNKEKTPYISHPIGVAVNLLKIGHVTDPAVIIGALLHDTVEDTDTTYAEIEEKFGKEIAGFVNEVSDDKSLPSAERKRLQVIHAAHISSGAAQIKLADKLYNLNDLLNNPPPDWSRSRIDQYYQWAKTVTDRLPSSNEHLKAAVDDLIHNYWDKQDKK